MVPLLLLYLLLGGSLQEYPGYELQVPELVRVQEGQCVHVPCSFSYPGSPQYPYGTLYTSWYWDKDNTNRDAPVATNKLRKSVKEETKGRFHLADPRANDCSLSIRDAKKTDTRTYIFRVESGSDVRYNYQDKKLKLQVTDLKPDILIMEPLVSGQPTQLTCTLPGPCKGESPFTFSWEGAAIASLEPQTLQSSVLTFTPRPQDHGTNLTCQVKHKGTRVTREGTTWLNIFYAPQNLAIGMTFQNVTDLKILQNTSSLPILEGEALKLLCVADSNPPAVLSWFRGTPDQSTAPLSSTAILDLHLVGTVEGQFTCQARNRLGSQSISVSLSVVYPPQLLGPSCSWEDEGLICHCSSRAQPAPSLHWRLGEGLLEENTSNTSYMVTSSSVGPWANSSLSLRLKLNIGLTLSCETENVHGDQRATVLLLPGPSVSLCHVVPTALGGAGAMALLSLCLCLIFFCTVKARRNRAVTPSVTNNEDPVMGTVTLDSQRNSGPDGPPNQVSFLEDGPLSIEDQDTHYANLTFHGRKLQKPQDKEATSDCVYSEVKNTGK